MGKYETYLAEKTILEQRNTYLNEILNHAVSDAGPNDISGNTSYLDADNIHGCGKNRDALHQLQAVMNIKIEMLQNMRKIEVLESSIHKIEDILMSADDVKVKVRYLRDLCGYPLADIAEKLGYSLIYIKKISASLKEYTD